MQVGAIAVRGKVKCTVWRRVGWWVPEGLETQMCVLGRQWAEGRQ